MNRWVVVLALGLSLPGCDVGTAALLLSGGKDSSDSDPVLAPQTDPNADFKVDEIFKAWVAFIPDSGAADLARTNLILLNGNPPDPPWKEIGQIGNNDFFNPIGDGTDINAILIQVSDKQNCALDCIEVMDADSNVLEYATGTTWSDLIRTDATSDPSFILGPPDGKTAVTQAADPKRAFIFALFTSPIDLFRINGHGDTLPPNPGDTVAVGSYSSLLNERPGGMAIDTNGLIHLTLSVGDTGRLVRYDMTGAIPSTGTHNVEISADLATVGSHSVALNSAGVVFTACSNSSGLVQVRSFAASNLGAVDSVAFASGFNSDRVEHNSIAVDSDGNIIVVGGMNSLLSGRNHWKVKLPEVISDPPIWASSSTSLDSSNTTYWHAVAAGPNGDAYVTGDNLSSLLGGTNQIYSVHYESAPPVATWEDSNQEGDVPADIGHAIALDTNGNLYVAGSVGTDLDGKEGVLLRYENATGTPAEAEIMGAQGLGLDEEILDVAIDPDDGSIYVVGYISVAGQGENFWVRKYEWNDGGNEFNIVWTRTHHGGFGNDRAVSCAIYQDNLVVAGYETNSTGQTKLVLRIYAK